MVMTGLTAKQWEVINCFKNERPKILICSGAKRSGKTFVLDYVFLAHIAKFKDMGLAFILGGSTQASIRRNVLDDVEKILGKELKIDKTNAVEIFGNKVYCFDGSNADAWKKVRGFTSAGAFLNEATALNDVFVKEVISRCSYDGARIIMDTNPENPMHTVKTDYIDKTGQRLADGQLNIKAFHFTLDDNTFLNKEYVESIKMSTPSGMFYDRDILGQWVSAEGVVYKDFNQNKHFISDSDIPFGEIDKYFCGVDWGYEHWGSIVLIGKSGDTYYLIKEVAAQHKEIDYWVEVAKEIKREYGNIMFYADSARPEHVSRFIREGIRTKNADKSVLSGIEVVASAFKQDKFFISNSVKRFKEEIFMYSWNEKTGEPVKEWDDCLDSIRYAIYTEQKKSGIAVLKPKSHKY